jgi:hypothetical protein
MMITAAAPETLLYASNQLAMCLAYGPADGETYRGLNWQDASGNLYAAASFEASDKWITAAQTALQRPAWDVDEVIDMQAAALAQAALVFSVDPVNAAPETLTTIGGMDGLAALAAMGLIAVDDSLA